MLSKLEIGSKSKHHWKFLQSIIQKKTTMTDITTREYEDIYITVPWGHITGRWYGDRDLRPILAIHGWLDNLGTWNTLIPLLPQHIGVLCIDLPGHGFSSHYPRGIHYHAVDYVSVIIRVMREYKWNKVSLLAHSLGSMVSFTYASLYPDTVDMIIAIDTVKPFYVPHDSDIFQLRMIDEKLLIEEERIDKLEMYEPPSYAYDQLKQVLYNGTNGSIDMDKCNHLLERNITKSKKFPDKYYFSRDGRVKYYSYFRAWPTLTEEMAKRIKNVPYLVIKGSNSNFINEESNEVIDILRRNNKYFEMHEISGTHHVHLNNAAECATVINIFINAHRPAMPNKWSVDNDETSYGRRKGTNRKKNVGKGPLRWLRKSKL